MLDRQKNQIILLQDPQLTKKSYGFLEELPFLDFTKDKADEHWVVVDSEYKIQARCSLWYKEKILLEDKVAGFIGHYDTINEEAAIALLNHAFVQLRQYNCAVAVGPIDGNIWRRYRFICDRGEEPVFFLEPDNPDYYPKHFLLAGFQPVANYFSASNNNLAVRDPKADSIEHKFKTEGVKLRPFSIENREADLDAIFKLSLQSFKSSFLYSPIKEDEFMEKYQALLAIIQTNFFLMAEDNDIPVGFVLALPNYSEGHKPKTIILKTVARHPANKYTGLGRYLIDQIQKEAFEKGYSRVIHALMIDQNVSSKISLRYASPIRKYAIYSRQLS